MRYGTAMPTTLDGIHNSGLQECRFTRISSLPSWLGNLVIAAKEWVIASLQDVVSKSRGGLLTAIAFFGTPLAGVIIDEVENRVGPCFSGK